MLTLPRPSVRLRNLRSVRRFLAIVTSSLQGVGGSWRFLPSRADSRASAILLSVPSGPSTSALSENRGPRWARSAGVARPPIQGVGQEMACFAPRHARPPPPAKRSGKKWFALRPDTHAPLRPPNVRAGLRGARPKLRCGLIPPCRFWRARTQRPQFSALTGH